jgi:hypothetical protein
VPGQLLKSISILVQEPFLQPLYLIPTYNINTSTLVHMSVFLQK